MTARSTTFIILAIFLLIAAAPAHAQIPASPVTIQEWIVHILFFELFKQRRNQRAGSSHDAKGRFKAACQENWNQEWRKYLCKMRLTAG